MKNLSQFLAFVCLSLVLGIAGISPVAAQDSLKQQSPELTDVKEYSQESPRAAVSRHLYYLHPETYQPELSADLIPGDLPVEQKIELVTQLRDVFDARGDYVEVEKIPNSPDYTDSVTGDHLFVIFPNKYPSVFLTKKDGLWYYSQTTVSRIPGLYEEYIPAGADLIKQLVPKVGNKEMLGLAIWKWMGLLIIVGLSYVLYRLLNWGFGLLFRRVLPKIMPKSYVDPDLIPPVARPLSAMLVILLFRSYFMPMLLLPIDVTDPLRRLLAILMSVFGVLVFYKLVDVAASLFKNLASKTETTMDDQLIPLLARAAKLVVVIFGLLFILDNLDVDVTALLAGVSIGGLAIALAAQDTVKNFIGSISIFVDRPFTVGDFIMAGDITGTVVEVGVRTTRIRALDGAAVTVPNGDLAARTITNHTIRTYRRYATSITVTYSTLPEKMEEFVEGVRAIVLSHEKVRQDSVIINFHEMSNSSLDIFYAAIFEVTDFGEWLACRQWIFLEVMKLADRLDIDFAFPSTSVYIEQMPQAQMEA